MAAAHTATSSKPHLDLVNNASSPCLRRVPGSQSTAPSYNRAAADISIRISGNAHRVRSFTITTPSSSPAASTFTYSRTSWRSVIQDEQPQSDMPSSVNEAASLRDSSPFSNNANDAELNNPTTGTVNDDAESAHDGNSISSSNVISAAQLRVKLSLAASSGRLDLTECGLLEVPEEVLQLTELEELQLSGNLLVALPAALSRLTALRRLGLAGNRLNSLPPGLDRLQRLEGLWLHGNLLTSLPGELGRLTALRVLSLAGNCLQSLPPGCLSGLTRLTDLTLAGNRLTALPPGELEPLTALTRLALNGNRLTTEGLMGRGSGGSGLGRQHRELRELMLQGNQLEEVDPAIFECPSLTELSLADNRLAALPPDLPPAPRLARLHLYGNRLTSLPPPHSLGAALPALSRCWLEGNPLRGEVVAELIEAAGGAAAAAGGTTGGPAAAETGVSGSMSRLKALGLDQTQLAAAEAAAAGRREATSGNGGGSGGLVEALPSNVRVGCVLGSGPGYFKLQYGPQRPVTAAAAGSQPDCQDGDVSSKAGCQGQDEGEVGSGDVSGAPGLLQHQQCSSSNELLVVAFGSAPGTPNWGGLLGSVYKAAASDAERYFDVLYVADPARDWYGGGSEDEEEEEHDILAADAVPDASSNSTTGSSASRAHSSLPPLSYYRCRLAAYTRPYRRVLLLGDSMGATGALLCADLATAVMAFCPQVDLTAASIRPGRPVAWLDCLRGRLLSAVRASRGRLEVLVGSWQHDLAQANMLPQQRGREQAREQPGGGLKAGKDAAAGRGKGGGVVTRAAVGAAVHRSPWVWQQRDDGNGEGGSSTAGSDDALGPGGDVPSDARMRSGEEESGVQGFVSVRVFSVDSHRLAAALDAQGQLVPLVRDAVLRELGLRSGNVRMSNML
ncbi:hypothetical protein Agub_g11048 [Astrephomene gubernaculifera]|uniref:Uncharacterized protein n=1 Tax=Astrephomene gubernaculifera TaxID=47775 RepID=A0AAD3HQB5_9CHLO|nr:hypothetical protein Agub_g11048 [Astrephomene gubernaculifera]